MAEFDVDALRAMLNNYDASKQESPALDNQDEQTATEESVVDNTATGEAQTTEPTTASVVDQPAVTIASQAEKDANAFAQMRAQNKMMSDMLAKIATANGVQYTDTNDMLAKLNDDSLTKIAAAQGIPKEYLERMESLERDANAFRAQQNQNRLTAQFQNIMTKYGVTPNELQSFAAELDNQKVDLGTVDLEKEYFFRNQEAIMQKRINAAVEAALRGDAEAAAQSTAPITTGANTGTATATVPNTVADLRAILANAR